MSQLDETNSLIDDLEDGKGNGCEIDRPWDILVQLDQIKAKSV